MLGVSAFDGVPQFDDSIDAGLGQGCRLVPIGENGPGYRAHEILRARYGVENGPVRHLLSPG